ncbi:MAG: hypothetical protein RLZZ387_5461 [Chloroflexota bacterium]
MSCGITAIVDSVDYRAAAAADDVRGWFAGWERALSRFQPDSELSQLNGGDAEHVRPISAELTLALGAALEAARWSEGLVVPTVLGALEAAGYGRSFETIALLDGEMESDVVVPDWRGIYLDAGRRHVRLPAGVRIDLGGTAKGWAADRAVLRLAAAGPALVDAGGDIAISGPMSDGSLWPIAVADPRAPDHELALLLIGQGGVATSGRDQRRWRRGGEWQHHIIDPRTGRPARTDVLSATVVGPSALDAEVAAKVVLLRGAEEGMAWIEERASFAALVVRANGDVLTSRRIASYRWSDELAGRCADEQ